MIESELRKTPGYMILQFVCRVARIVSVLFWLLTTMFVVPVAVDQTGVLGRPSLPGNYFIPGDNGRFPTYPSASYKLRMAGTALSVVLYFVISIAPRKLICSKTLVYYTTLVYSFIPGFITLSAIACDLMFVNSSNTRQELSVWMSIVDMLIVVAALSASVMIIFALPVSLALSRYLSQKTASSSQ